MSERQAVGTDLEFIRYLRENGGASMKKCFQCATCTVACELSPKDNAFPRKEMIWAAWGRKDRLVKDADIWLCHGCMDCSQQCPRGARPADLMATLRNYVYRHYANPNFMGKALSSPKYLPALFVVPIILIFILVLITQGGDLGNIDWSSRQFKYAEFLAHGPIEALFVIGNIVIFSLAFIGFKKYWDDLNSESIEKPKMSFIQSFFCTTIEFIQHKKFSRCPTNSNKHMGHLFVFYGFIGALIATAIVVLDIFGHKLGLLPKFLPEHMNLPLYLLGGVDYSNWNELVELFGLVTKMIGIIGGFMLIVGGLMLIIRRYNTPQNESKTTYGDFLFLWILWLVAATGMSLVFLRLLQFPTLAFPTYFVHMVFVYFLLWYMPYSKFAHMIYRYIGLIYLRMIGRDNKPEIYTSESISYSKEIA